nr:hypothetical protein [Tanacetum cinerariifolium]
QGAECAHIPCSCSIECQISTPLKNLQYLLPQQQYHFFDLYTQHVFESVESYPDLHGWSLKVVMANSNPGNLNVPNKGVPEEDPHHLLDYDEEEDLEMEIEEEEPKEEPVEEPKPLPGHGDQFDAHPNPHPGNMNGWVDDDDDDDDDVEEEEDEENEDADIKEDDDAEIIFPYEVQGDQTPQPRDESSDSEFEAEEADDELEVEEACVEPEVEEAGDEPEAEGC